MSDFQTMKEQEAQYVLPTYSRFDLALDHGQGALLYDTEGNEYIDMTSGIGVNCLGHNHPALCEALNTQASKLMQASNLFYTQPMIDAARKLCQATGMKGVFFANSGAEANEGAIKCARKYSADKYGRQRSKILTLKNSFHGRTIATLEATGQDVFHQDFHPYTGAFDTIEPGNLDDLKAKDDGTVAAVMAELIQGESGVRPLDKEYVKEVVQYCHDHDILFIADEVQTGIGRTGKLFCWQNYEIEPDLTTMAKGLGGGIPIGGFMAGEKVAKVLSAGDHGSTFGGNPLSTACANTVLDIVAQEDFLQEVDRKGELLRSLLKEIDTDNVKDVRGQGLMVGVEVEPEKLMGYIKAMREKGLLVLKAGKNTIRLLPPLVITDEEIQKAADIMKEVLENDEASA